MKEKILKMLEEAKDYVSGQKICEQLEVSRTAIWKAINQLKEEGYVIEAVTNKGYRLVQCPDLINEQAITSKLQTKFWGKKVHFFEETDSTNNVIKKLAENGAEHGTLAIAEIQTAGKGRRGRSWSSPKGSGIWMSFLLRPQIAPEKASMITLVAALAARKAVYEITGMDALIKWPNDIVLSGKKICGMLTEMSAEMEWINYVVVGIGFNVNTEEFPEEIRNVASSMKIEGGKAYTRSEVVAAFGSAFEEYYAHFIETGDLSKLLEEYNGHLANMDNKVRIIEMNQEFTGTSHGINELGELLVTDEAGQEHVIRSGEVSVRGIYGYV